MRDRLRRPVSLAPSRVGRAPARDREAERGRRRHGAVCAGRPGNAGSATVAVIGALALVVLVGTAAVTGAALADAAARAQAGADLAAVAAAHVARDERALGRIGAALPCETAAAVAARHSAELIACHVTARGVVEVEVKASAGSLPGAPPVTRRAAAGPASASRGAQRRARARARARRAEARASVQRLARASARVLRGLKPGKRGARRGLGLRETEPPPGGDPKIATAEGTTRPWEA